MRKFFLAGTALLSLAVGCVPSPEQLCETQVDVSCDKVYQCYSDAERKQLESIFGTSVSDCKTKLVKTFDCASKKNQDDLCKDSTTGTKFNLSNASKCIDAVKAQSCTDFRDTSGTKEPAVCDQVCTK